jgi:hypothetical protein
LEVLSHLHMNRHISKREYIVEFWRHDGGEGESSALAFV